MDIVINAQATGSIVQSPGNYYVNLLTCLGYPADSPPVADLLRKLHGLDGTWLVVSPIHWQATHNDAMIVACDSELQLSDDESRQWFTALAEFLAQDHAKLYYHDAYTWLIQLNTRLALEAKPVHALLQQSMTPHLKALDATLFWQRFITENQMFFSEHALNKMRLDRYSINGIWVWGAGSLKPPESRAIVCGDTPACDLAKIVSTQVSRYQPGQSFAKHTLLLLSALNDQIPIEFKKNTVRWYWNNTAYVTKPKNWFTPFWRT